MCSASDSTKTGEHSKPGEHTGESGWKALNLTYAVEWPLHILFTPSVLERYVSRLNPKTKRKRRSTMAINRGFVRTILVCFMF